MNMTRKVHLTGQIKPATREAVPTVMSIVGAMVLIFLARWLAAQG